MNKIIYLFLAFIVLVQFLSCGKKTEQSQVKEKKESNTQIETREKAKVTFIELGSVNCIPCKQMQPVMKSIEEKYKGQVKVIFYDVWKDKKPAQQYGIKLIPTQVFLDESGKEFFRHEGFYPEEEIDKLMQTKGLTILQ